MTTPSMKTLSNPVKWGGGVGGGKCSSEKQIGVGCFPAIPSNSRV